MLEQGVGTRSFEHSPDPRRQVGIGEPPEQGGIFEDLRDHFPPGLRVSPKLALDENEAALRRDREQVEEHGGTAIFRQRQLASDHGETSGAGIDQLDRDELGMLKQQVL